MKLRANATHGRATQCYKVQCGCGRHKKGSLPPTVVSTSYTRFAVDQVPVLVVLVASEVALGHREMVSLVMSTFDHQAHEAQRLKLRHVLRVAAR
jgi:hypothetical protein